MNKSVNILLWVLRIAVGVLFIISGFLKADDPKGFAYKLDEYWEVFHVSFLHFSSLFLAWFFSVFEIAVGFALLVGWRMRWVAWILLLLIVFFTFLTWYSWYFDAVQDCGCFGDAIKLTPFQSFTKDLVLLVLVLPIFLFRNKIQPVTKNWMPAAVSILSFAAFGWFGYRNIAHLPYIEFIKAYKVGADLQYNMSTMNPETQEPYAKDFFEFCAESGDTTVGNGFQGKTLYIVLYDPAKAPEWALKDAGTFAAEVKTALPDVKVCGGTNLLSTDRGPMAQQYGWNFCLSAQDQKMLKTMIRSSPGYLFLKDGKILGKWHYNDRPTVEQLKQLAP